MCTYGDTALMMSITQAIAFSTGCWAANAANQGNLCHACGVMQGGELENANRNIAGVGSSCQGQVTNTGNSCIATTYRIDVSKNTCVRTATNLPSVTGVMCCAN